jgi:hypothetical protein
MTCKTPKIPHTFKMPIPNTPFRVMDHVGVLGLDYVLGISDAIYTVHGYKQFVDNASEVISVISSLVNNRGTSYCVTDPAIMKERREFLSNEYVMKTMEGKLSQFDLSFINILSDEKFDEMMRANPNKITLSNNSFKSLAAAFPKVYKETKERTYFNDVISEVASKSSYVGDLKSRYNFKLKLLSKRFVSDKGFWVVNALNEEKDIVTFFDAKATSDPTCDLYKIKVGDMFKLRGTVVKHNFSTYTKCKETRLSRIVYS